VSGVVWECGGGVGGGWSVSVRGVVWEVGWVSVWESQWCGSIGGVALVSEVRCVGLSGVVC
jgi:hypothetical protein